MIGELRVYNNPTDLKKRRLAEKLSSMLYISFILAENNKINLEESFLQTINDYILEFVT